MIGREEEWKKVGWEKIEKYEKKMIIEGKMDRRR